MVLQNLEIVRTPHCTFLGRKYKPPRLWVSLNAPQTITLSECLTILSVVPWVMPWYVYGPSDHFWLTSHQPECAFIWKHDFLPLLWCTMLVFLSKSRSLFYLPEGDFLLHACRGGLGHFSTDFGLFVLIPPPTALGAFSNLQAWLMDWLALLALKYDLYWLMFFAFCQNQFFVSVQYNQSGRPFAAFNNV